MSAASPISAPTSTWFVLPYEGRLVLSGSLNNDTHAITLLSEDGTSSEQVFTVGYRPTGVSPFGSASLALALNASGMGREIAIWSARTGKVESFIDVEQGVWGVVESTDSETLYAYTTQGEIDAINVATQRVVGEFSAPTAAGMVLGLNGSAYFAAQNGTIETYDVASQDIEAHFDTGLQAPINTLGIPAHLLSVDLNDGKAVLVSQSANEAAIVDLLHQSELRKVNVCSKPIDVETASL
jgi:hypothetical protein